MEQIDANSNREKEISGTPERAELPTFWVVTMADDVSAEITPGKR
jgi:hypothetical protein